MCDIRVSDTVLHPLLFTLSTVQHENVKCLHHYLVSCPMLLVFQCMVSLFEINQYLSHSCGAGWLTFNDLLKVYLSGNIRYYSHFKQDETVAKLPKDR